MLLVVEPDPIGVDLAHEADCSPSVRAGQGSSSRHPALGLCGLADTVEGMAGEGASAGRVTYLFEAPRPLPGVRPTARGAPRPLPSAERDRGGSARPNTRRSVPPPSGTWRSR